jgi:hypothetical protein
MDNPREAFLFALAKHLSENGGRESFNRLVAAGCDPYSLLLLLTLPFQGLPIDLKDVLLRKKHDAKALQDNFLKRRELIESIANDISAIADDLQELKQRPGGELVGFEFSGEEVAFHNALMQYSAALKSAKDYLHDHQLNSAFAEADHAVALLIFYVEQKTRQTHFGELGTLLPLARDAWREFRQSEINTSSASGGSLRPKRKKSYRQKNLSKKMITYRRVHAGEMKAIASIVSGLPPLSPSKPSQAKQNRGVAWDNPNS